MIYSLNFILLLTQLLFTQSADPKEKHFYQQLLTTTNRLKFLSTSSFPTQSTPPISYRHAFRKQFYYKTQTTTSSTGINVTSYLNKGSGYYQVIKMPKVPDWDTPRMCERCIPKVEKVYQTFHVSCHLNNGNMVSKFFKFFY